VVQAYHLASDRIPRRVSVFFVCTFPNNQTLNTLDFGIPYA